MRCPLLFVVSSFAAPVAAANDRGQWEDQAHSHAASASRSRVLRRSGSAATVRMASASSAAAGAAPRAAPGAPSGTPPRIRTRQASCMVLR